MTLEDRQDLGTQQVAVIEGDGFYVALSEPTGGEAVLGIELPPALKSKNGPHYVIVKTDAAHARDIAASLIELAEALEGSQ